MSDSRTLFVVGNRHKNGNGDASVRILAVARAYAGYDVSLAVSTRFDGLFADKWRALSNGRRR